ncbi:MAG: hypothetical protein A3C43_05885 [Candidatus Schekmanbacteria bacterium RIFCSPHIGHO2_02_FULL_38_11]|uniref:Uncharacterized protein n=1 Tax=Candidatus Schekmanbacteria bacterium RIFCSPLOWO2_12_FULL_38_15 TaxID=1817883 RepID=A0A1F7SNQ4_9BACT|nr:MAG: hypothetical protein A2043_06565 [Candidatus Schekmanbacteria bacterium GWA2_38_9]OGL50280.1 MAG: hypothetical protein A3H37_00815 [Candidatus Schekmanbacteria bacterium RIFCSPLOWO2_02_FULL_38_14]OGL55409.1 MAG: hypothetical protein A3G31_01185 [Candidatus Schekmanbacteria bacterium RIFCSPLOWO2_12_FULL_38_15]OGL55676.1 MAG: hypothetical protein A3C43_05885 [Candidatus Schekmanbacteria bacterium RIFCSPHIGHO2_02_FULL_38_11]
MAYILVSDKTKTSASTLILNFSALENILSLPICNLSLIRRFKIGMQKRISKKLTKKLFSKPYQKNFKWRKKNNNSLKEKLIFLNLSQ